MELFQLRYFDAVVAHGSFTSAAEACHVSQPSLSAQIKSLEDELGIILLERKPRGVSPTKAGERLAASTRKILAEVETVRRDLQRLRYHEAAVVRIGVQPFLASELLPRALADFLGAESARRVEVQERSSERLLEAVQNEEVDFGLMVLPTAMPDTLDHLILFSSGYAAFCDPKHPLANQSGTTLKDVLPHRLLIFDDKDGLADRIGRLAERSSLEAQIILVSDQAHAIFEMASAGAGVAILPRLFVERAERRNLKAVPIEEPALDLIVGAVWTRATHSAVEIEDLLSRIAAPFHTEKAAQSGIPTAVGDFIQRQINSLEELEVLLLLHAGGDQTWTVEQVHGRVQSSLPSVSRSLAALVDAKLVTTTGGDSTSYRYSPASAVLDQQVAALALAYRQRRTKVIERIFSKPSSRIRGFSDAFKLKKDDHG